MYYKSISDLSLDIKKNLSAIQNLNIDLVVGVPRSGMIPAYAIALYLNVDCTDITSFIDNIPLKKGNTRVYNNNILLPHEAQRILLVDDSIDSGRSISNVLLSLPIFLKSKVKTLAIYSSLARRDDIDLFLEHVPHPRVFEWNIYHHPIIKKSCVDIDGVLCRDPTPDENDDGEKYKFFLLNAEPLFIPSVKIFALVTSRLEKYRPETEAWLEKNNIKYERLIMLDLPTKEERMRLGAHSIHKAKYYKETGASFFIESEINQAVNICERTGKPVYCVDSNQLITATSISSFLKNPDIAKNKIKSLCQHLARKIRK